ncbi:MAG: hypothetical protein ABEI86_11535 [Halobacteriaceae archaeon]
MADGGTGIAKMGTKGKLQISVTNLGSNVKGLNPIAKYTFGDKSAISSTSSEPAKKEYVFSITNRDDVEHSVTISFKDDSSGAALSKENINIIIIDNDGGSSGGTKTVKVGDSVTITIPAGGTWYVVIEFNTGIGSANDLTASDTISGTLNVSV